MVGAMLSIMRAGFTYVPLDPSYPEARIEQICNNAELKCVISSTKPFPLSVDLQDAAVVMIDTLQPTLVRKVFPVLRKADIAYVLYTSGSTGTPKGVAVPHSSIFYSIHANRNVIADINQTDAKRHCAACRA